MAIRTICSRWNTKLIAAVAVVSLAGFVACSTSSPAGDSPDEAGDQHEAHADDHDHHGSHAHGSDHHDHSFDDPEEYAQRWNDPQRDEWQQPAAIIDAMEIQEGMTVADIGAGTGYFIPFLAEAVGDEGKVVAVDIEESMLEFIDQLADEEGLDNVETVLAGADDSGLDAESVDRILTVNTWHHIPDREAYSAHLAERLVEGGSVWNVDFHEDSPVGPPSHHRLDPQVVVDEMEAGGLDARVHELQLERQYVVVGQLN